MTLQSISPQAAADLVAKGAVLVDIREADKRALAPWNRHTA